MKKIIISGLLTAGLALCSLTASAAGDDQYPAANFQPKVVFIDKDAAAAASSSSESAAPKCAEKAAAAKQSEFDPKYPAASFEPKVVYPN